MKCIFTILKHPLHGRLKLAMGATDMRIGIVILWLAKHNAGFLETRTVALWHLASGRIYKTFALSAPTFQTMERNCNSATLYGNFLCIHVREKGRPARKADNFTVICEMIV
jgi:hypothetical protein